MVRNNSLGLSEDTLRLISYAPGSAALALDMLGFTFLCISVFLLLPIFLREAILRIFIIVNGLLAAPTFAFPIFFIPRGSTMSDQVGRRLCIKHGVLTTFYLPHNAK